MRHRIASLAAASLCLMTLAGCAASKGPQLTTIDAAIPAGVSFDGRWRLRSEPGDPDPDASLSRPDGIVLPPQGRTGARQPKPQDGSSVHVFLEFGTTLKITQTEYALFISFDRAVVEEYRFREHRTVSVGPIEAERVSGWESGGYVIRTIDEKGGLLTEKLSLEDDGRTLVRDIRIDYRDETKFTARRRFDRVE